MGQLDCLVDPTAPIDPAAIEERKEQTKNYLLTASETYPEIGDSYDEDEEFKEKVDNFVEEFELASLNSNEGRFKGGLNLINSGRIYRLIEAVDNSSITFTGQSEQDYVEAIEDLDGTDKAFIRKSNDWQDFVAEQLSQEDQADFWSRVQ